MPDQPTVEVLQRQLKRRGVRLNTLHAALRIPAMDERKKSFQKEREQRIIKLVTMLGGVRAPHLVSIVALPQPTVWRIVDRLRRSGALRVVTTYRDGVPGRRAAWIQPAGSADLSDDKRAELIEPAERIRAYRRPWEMEQARALAREQGIMAPWLYE